MKAYLIDPAKRSILEVGTDAELQSIYDLLGVDIIEAVRPVNVQGDIIYIDEEGKLKDDQPMFFCRLWPHDILMGKGLWIGTDEEGNNASAEMPLAYVKAHIVWVDADHKMHSAE
jgi:hypothetical protein